MAAVPACRTSVAGDEFPLLVLAAPPGEAVGVDLHSGALARVVTGVRFRPLDVVSVVLGHTVADWCPHAPELVEPAFPPEAQGRLPLRWADRRLRGLVDPPTRHLLGFVGPSVPYWTLEGDRPSLAVVTPHRGPAVVRTGREHRCLFTWRSLPYDLPLLDTRLVGMLQHRPDRSWRLLVGLTPPRAGHCRKAVLGLLPRP